MDEMHKYYQILWLKPWASKEEINRAYKDLIKVWHPDRFFDNERLKEKANEKLKEIILAYKKLTKYVAGSEFYDETFESETEQPATSDDKQEPQPPPHEPPPRSRREQSNATVRKCPFCLQKIQDNAIQCDYCHESVSGISFPFKVKGLSLSLEGFGYKDKRYGYDEITNTNVLNKVT